MGMGSIRFIQAGKDYKATEKTIGEGKPGLKTLALRADRAAIERSGLYFPSHASFTPKFFQRFLWESGALKANDHYEAQNKVGEGEFSPKEKQEIKEAILSLHPLLRSRLIVRSDDYAAGIGLGHTGPAVINTRYDVEPDELEKLVLLVEEQMKHVLIYDFEPGMCAFKEKKNIHENAGIILMPIFGVVSEEGIVPPISINFLGKVDGEALVSIGAGIGGANEKLDTLHGLYDEIPINRILRNRHLTHGKIAKPNSTWFELGDISDIIRTCMDMNEWVPDLFSTINNMVDELIDEVGPRYLEIVRDDIQSPHWVVVQSAPFEPKIIEKPELGEGYSITETDQVVGKK